MWYFAVSVGAVHSDSTVSVVRFDIAGTLKKKVGVALPASAAQSQKNRRVEKVRKFWLLAVSIGDLAAKRQLPFGPPLFRGIPCRLKFVEYRHWNSFNMRFPKYLYYHFCVDGVMVS